MAGKPGACVFFPYDLRHTAATRWATDGMPIPVLAATLGHANLRSVMKYIHITADNIEREIVRIEKMRLNRVNDVSSNFNSVPDDKAQLHQRLELGGTSCATDPCFDSGDTAANPRSHDRRASLRETK